ncbi:MAG: phage regulatory protein/antirepressor Ant [Methylocella sp.]
MNDEIEMNSGRQPVVAIKNGDVLANSRDVASYFAKNHRDVLRDIDNLIASEPTLGLRNFAHTPYIEAQNGQTYRSYDMDRKGFAVIAMGFTGAKALKWKLAYIDAFDAMEAELRARPAIDPIQVLNDPTAMRGLLLTYSEKVLALEADKAAAAPKIAALERIAEADGSLCITDSAKTLQVRPTELFKFLRHHSWIYRRPGTDHDVAYQSKLVVGLLEHKTTTVHRSDGSEKITTQVRITPKGLTRLAQELPPALRVA